MKDSGKEAPAVSTKIYDQLIAAGVKNLHEFGYPDCNNSNILSDQIYSAFFKSMLEDNLGKGVDENISRLLERIATSVVNGGKL